MSYQLPDHPEIQSAERTGYPSWNRAPGFIYCDECGSEITCDIYEDERHSFLCEECLRMLHKKEDY